jgi:hypothetical protein
MRAMLCPKCGKENLETAPECEKCGEALESASSSRLSAWVWTAAAPGAVMLLAFLPGMLGGIVVVGFVVVCICLAAELVIFTVEYLGRRGRPDGSQAARERPGEVRISRAAVAAAVLCGITVANGIVLEASALYRLRARPTLGVDHWLDTSLGYWFTSTLILAVAVGAAGAVALALAARRSTALRGRELARAAIRISALASGFALAVLLILPVQLREVGSQRKAVCLSNVKSLALAVQMYLDDNDLAFPPASRWCESLTPYVDGPEVFLCPEAPGLSCAYAYNSALDGVEADSLSDRVRTVAIFESDGGWNASGGPKLLAEEARHLGGDDYGFADGHAAWWSRQRAMLEEGGLRWEP